MRLARVLALAVSVGALFFAAFAHAQQEAKARELVALHDLRATFANSELYLKSELLTAARALLRREGAARAFGKEWQPANPHWKRAEAALAGPVWETLRQRLHNREWLIPQWVALNVRDFSAADLDALRAHFSTDVGYQQRRMLDHALANNVLGAFSLTWRMKTDVAGTEQELARAQEFFYRGEEAMIFDVVNSQEGIRFSFTPYGKRYTYDIITNVVLMFVRELQTLASEIPAILQSALPKAQPGIEAFAKSR